MTPLNVRQWAYCLKQNPIYKMYSKAKADSSSETCLELEQKYTKIAELFKDWGHLDAITITDDSVELFDDRGELVSVRRGAETAKFRSWLEIKAQLFFVPTASTHIITDASSYQYSPGMVLMNICMYDEMHKTIKEVTQMIDHIYQYRGDYDYSFFNSEVAVEKIKAMSGSLPKPKYGLCNSVNSATEGRIKKAIYCHQLQPLSQTDAVIFAMQDSKNPFEWAMTDSDETAHAQGTFKKTLFNSSKVKMLVKANQDFEALVKNTIHGRFPDFS